MECHHERHEKMHRVLPTHRSSWIYSQLRLRTRSQKLETRRIFAHNRRLGVALLEIWISNLSRVNRWNARCYSTFTRWRNRLLQLQEIHSIIAFAVAGSNLRFIYLNVGAPGRCNDASVYNRSTLAELARNPGANGGCHENQASTVWIFSSQSVITFCWN